MDGSIERPDGVTAGNGKALAFLWSWYISACVVALAPERGTPHIAITPQIRRQKIDTSQLIAKRHKTVRSFFDEFFKIFFDAGTKISRNSFALYISGQNTRVLSD
ncbi:hypothetical protein [Pseudomonas sp. 32_A]|jgi:hypothetical protein|uniref:hypothetical protein n=1 Tax=unclassified Pseudomonas TaxID=196821 RepID=UPI001A9F7DDD|nr:hypothetical protein [Pseudomonas sp. 32_A]